MRGCWTRSSGPIPPPPGLGDALSMLSVPSLLRQSPSAAYLQIQREPSKAKTAREGAPSLAVAFAEARFDHRRGSPVPSPSLPCRAGIHGGDPLLTLDYQLTGGSAAVAPAVACGEEEGGLLWLCLAARRVDQLTMHLLRLSSSSSSPRASSSQCSPSCVPLRCPSCGWRSPPARRARRQRRDRERSETSRPVTI